MIIYKGKDYQDVSRKAANIMSAQIIMKPDAVLGLATGSTPVGMYAQLVEWYKKGDLDFSQVTTVNLDEYKGISGDNEQSYRYFMNKNLFDHINIDKNKTFVPDGLEENSDKACAEYNAVISRTGGVDMQLLGIGENGHIGFNEPGAAFEKETHCVDLTESTIRANARFLTAWMRFRSRHIPWESKISWQPEKSFLWQPVLPRQRLYINRFTGRSRLMFRHPFFSCIWI